MSVSESRHYELLRQDPEYQQCRTLWQDRFGDARNVFFDGKVLRNAYCPDCRYCCGPQIGCDPFPMALLDSQLSDRTEEDFYLMDAHTASLDERGCKSITPQGCRLKNEQRPVACNLFPFVLADMRLYLYECCPAAMFLPREELVRLGKEVASYLASLPLSDVERISIHLPDSDLERDYLDLNMDLGACFREK